jgi:hypothetical protein
MGDKWDKAYDVIKENWGFTSLARNIREEDPMPQAGQPAPAPAQPAQDQGMGDMNQQDQGQQGMGQQQPQRTEGEWNDDIKAQAQELISKSLKDLYNGKDSEAQTDFVKNIAGPAIKAELGVQNVPYKELHALLAGGEGDQEGGAETAPEDDMDTTGGDVAGQGSTMGEPSAAGDDQQVKF